MRFRPQAKSPIYMLKRHRMGDYQNYNFLSIIDDFRRCKNTTLNRRAIGRVFGRLHYLACHAPAPVQKRYRGPYELLLKRLLPTRNVSMRYLRDFTPDSWL